MARRERWTSSRATRHWSSGCRRADASEPWQFRTRGQPVELHQPSRVLIDDGEALAAAACAGVGIAQLPDNMVDQQIARGELVELLPGHRPAPMPVSAVYPSGRLVPPRVRAVLEALERLR